jgi:hypothetical protein
VFRNILIERVPDIYSKAISHPEHTVFAAWVEGRGVRRSGSGSS